MKVKIYHNPKCSKSRATLALLKDRSIDIDVVEYLKSPLTADELRGIIDKLGITAADLVRTGETAFKQSGLSLSSPAEDLLELMAREPVVMQRPIVVIGEAARIGRPPEQVLELLA